MTTPYPFHAEDQGTGLPQADLRPGGPIARSLDDAIAALPPMGLAEAIARAAARREQRAQARALYEAAVDRVHRDPLVAMRARLAAEVATGVGLTVPLDEDARDRLVARAASAVALELVERERDTTDAKLARIRDLVCRALETTPGAAPVTVTVEAVLAAMGDPR